MKELIIDIRWMSIFYHLSIIRINIYCNIINNITFLIYNHLSSSIVLHLSYIIYCLPFPYDLLSFINYHLLSLIYYDIYHISFIVYYLWYSFSLLFFIIYQLSSTTINLFWYISLIFDSSSIIYNHLVLLI